MVPELHPQGHLHRHSAAFPSGLVQPSKPCVLGSPHKAMCVLCMNSTQGGQGEGDLFIIFMYLEERT